MWEGAEGAAEVEAKLSAVLGGEKTEKTGGEKDKDKDKDKDKEASSVLSPHSPPGPAELSRLIERELLLASARVHVLGGELKASFFLLFLRFWRTVLVERLTALGLTFCFGMRSANQDLKSKKMSESFFISSPLPAS